MNNSLPIRLGGLHNSCLPILLSFFLLTSCMTPLPMNRQAQIEELGVCLNFDNAIPPERYASLEAELDQYIQTYNRQGHAFRLTRCPDSNQSTISINVADIRLVSPSKQVAGVVVSAVGLIGVPALLVSAGAPFYAFFYYFPKNQTFANLEFSSDLADPNVRHIPRVYASSGFLGNEKAQINRHTRKFEAHLNLLFSEIERNYRRNRAQG